MLESHYFILNMKSGQLNTTHQLSNVMVATIGPHKLPYEIWAPKRTFIPTHLRYTFHPGQQTGTHDRRMRPCGHGCMVTWSYIHPPFIRREKCAIRQCRLPTKGGQAGHRKKAKAARQHWGQPDEGNKAAAEATLSRTHQEKQNRAGEKWGP